MFGLEFDLQHLPIDQQLQGDNSGCFLFDGPDNGHGLPPFIGVGASENKIDSNFGQLLRVVNQDFVDSQINLYVNGNCHGQ